jgi:hypothetical protein
MAPGAGRRPVHFETPPQGPMSEQRFGAATHYRGTSITTTEVDCPNASKRCVLTCPYMFHVVPGRSTRSVALTQKKLCDCPPMRRVAVPPVTSPNASTSSGKVDGHREGVITIFVSVPVVVSPVFHVTTKVPVPVVCMAPPPEIQRWLHPAPWPTLPAAVLAVKYLQLTIIGFGAGAALAGDALRPTRTAVPTLAAATLGTRAVRRERKEGS